MEKKEQLLKLIVDLSQVREMIAESSISVKDYKPIDIRLKSIHTNLLMLLQKEKEIQS